MNYQTLERTIGHSFADIALLDLAMTHPSYALQHKCQDNQRLEFLGDAVLEICVSRVLYHKYPKLREGQLTRKRAALVCEANLARAATRLGLGSYLKLDRGEEVVGGRIGHFDCNPNANDSFLCVKNKLAGIVNSHEEKSFAGKLRYVTD